MKRIKVIQTVVFMILTLLVVCFIFRNSLKNIAQSKEQSSQIVELLEPILAPVFNGSEEKMDVFVRKAAHFVEFSMLGFCLGGFADGLCRHFWKRVMLFLPLFLLLAVAVTDELLQSFNDRGSMVSDVVLDFCGGLFGLAALCVLFGLIRVLMKRRGLNYG